MGLIALATELERQIRAGRDDKYLKGFVYYFELRVPPHVAKGPNTSFIYPLVIPPESIRITEPFKVTQRFTNRSGLFVEENGVIARQIHISGTTGFRPRKLPKALAPSGNHVLSTPREGRSYSRNQVFAIAEAMSGQRHFQFIQDVVFRTYGDLKRDPSTSEGTELYWHNPKDDEHWRVVPLEFSGERTAQRTTLWPYEISLLAVDAADAPSVDFSEDRSVVEQIQDAVRMLRFGTQTIQAALLDLVAVQGQVRTVLLGIDGPMEDAALIADAVSDFVDGARDAVAVPHAYTLATIEAIEATIDAAENARLFLSGPDVSDSALNIVRRVIDGLLVVASYPEQYQKSLNAAYADVQDAAETKTEQGLTHSQAGDSLRAEADLGLGRGALAYRSVEEHVVQGGDTLSLIAARLLGDASQWSVLALLNDLDPPYISRDGLPRTLGVGDTILVPSTARSLEERGETATLGVPVDQASEERAYGVDVLMQHTRHGLYGFVIDEEGGSVDWKLARGRVNLQQAIRARLITERGSDPLFRNIGALKSVGFGLTIVDRDMVNIRLAETVQADPRVVAVRNVRVDDERPDLQAVEMDVEVRGASRPERVIVQEE